MASDGIKVKYVRWVFQFGSFYFTFPLFLPIFYCPYRLPWVACGSCSVFWCPAKYMRNQIAYLIVGLTVLSGRVFCGWVCPYGSLQDLFNKASRKLSGSGDLPVKDNAGIKYIILVLTLIAVAHILGFLHIPILDDIIPSAPKWIPLLLGFFLLLSVFVSRLFCRFLCPIGAATSILNKASLFSVKLDEEKCIKCAQCKRPCIMVSDEKKVNTTSSDCIVCGECVSKCPKNALKYGLR
jgi:ferredoxin-type protein NapH